MKQQWISGNRITLLENGEQYFPRVFDAIDKAQHEVVIETFILYEDKVGVALHDVLVAAAGRGVEVDLTIDGFGSPDLSPKFISSLTSAGVRIHVFDPGRKILGKRLNVFRRMHRKLLVVDARLAFIGGINFSADHLADFGPEAKLDYAAQVEGPIVTEMHAFMRRQLAKSRSRRRFFRRPEASATPSPLAAAGNAKAIFVTRDNTEHTSDIERHYRLALRSARQRVVIANAYFFPGYRFLYQLRRAARRGVDVRLIVQGEPDMAIARYAARMLYHHLLRAGVAIFEFCERPMHSKVALMDEDWATIGSSNLDPLSLSLNLEANLMILDRDFNRQLSDHLGRLMQISCKRIQAGELNEPRWWLSIRNALVFHFLRHFPAWMRRLPSHPPTLTQASTRLPEGVETIGEPAEKSIE